MRGICTEYSINVSISLSSFISFVESRLWISIGDRNYNSDRNNNQCHNNTLFQTWIQFSEPWIPTADESVWWHQPPDRTSSDVRCVNRPFQPFSRTTVNTNDGKQQKGANHAYHNLSFNHCRVYAKCFINATLTSHVRHIVSTLFCVTVQWRRALTSAYGNQNMARTPSVRRLLHVLYVLYNMDYSMWYYPVAKLSG